MRKLIPTLFFQIVSLTLFGQYAPIDTFIASPINISIEQKISLKKNLQHFLTKIDQPAARLLATEKYYDAALSKSDSFFIAHSLEQLALLSAIVSDTFQYHLEGEELKARSSIERIYLQENQHYLYNFINHPEASNYFEKYRMLQSQYGLNTSELPQQGTIDLYPALEIFKETNGRASFEKIRTDKEQFGINNTLADFDPTATYWVKLTLRGREQQVDTCAFFVENMVGYASWEQIDAYLVHEDGQVEQQRTGIDLVIDKKPLPLPNNIVRFGIAPNEKATLYLRLTGITKNRSPRSISLLGTRSTHLKSDPFYQTNGTFNYASAFTPFRGNKIENRRIFIDSTKQKTIEYIATNWDKLPYSDGYDTNFATDNSHWAKIRLASNPNFHGTQFFHAAPYPFVGADGFNFNKIDYYFRDSTGAFLHRRTGFKVPLSERAYDFWANFLKVEVPLNDTLDVFIRLEGGNPRFVMHRLDFWHIDASSIFPNQMKEATKNAWYYGILGIQCLFFLLLFGIEKARIHCYFALFILGIFLAQGFGEDNYRFFVPFPMLRDYHTVLFFLGMFLIQVGFLNFASCYFNYAKTAFLNRFFIPIYLSCSALVNSYAAVQFAYSDFGEYPVNQGYYIAAILFLFFGLIISFLIGLFTTVKNRTPKLFFITAFLPGLLIGLLFLVRVILGGMFGNVFIAQYFSPFLFTYDAIKLSIILMLFLFALSMGYRTNLLKADKEKALQQNLKAQQTIIENLQKNSQLQELNKLKTRFFTNITHEFRTPLTVILGMAEQKSHPQAISLIRRNGQRLLHLINQLLDLSKLDAGQLKPNYQEIEIVSFTQYIGESFQSLAEKKFIRLTIYSEIHELWLDMDEEKFRQIVSNLLSNAIKFTPENGKIVLHLFQKDQQFYLKIVDNGMGIAAKELPYIFDRFYQVENTHSQQGKGTGIGLALVKELVELMDGTIQVESEINKRTAFIIHFPVRRNAPSRLTQFDPIKVDSTIIEKEAIEPTKKKADLPKLLIVEDNPDVIIYIQSLLNQQYDLQVATNGAMGVEKAIEAIPDIIISDVMMPKKNGFELVETLKQDERTSHIPIILLTAKATQQDKLKGLKYGVDAYLMKPFDKAELFIRLEKLLTLRLQLQEKYADLTLSVINTPKEKTLDDIFLEKLHTILENNYKETALDVKQLANHLCMTYIQLNRKLKALTNQTPAKYLRDFRLEKAKTFLLDTTNDLNVSEVAYEVGFTDPNYFSRSFSTLFGRSPNSIRKQVSGN